MGSPLAAKPQQVPAAIDAEQSVIGGLLLNNRAWYELGNVVAEEDFYTLDHRQIFRAIGELLNAGKPCDFVTLSEHLRHQGKLDEVGGMSYLGTLSADTPSAANVSAYAQIVRERAVQRSLIAAGQDIAELGYRPDGLAGDELLAKAQQLVIKLQGRTSGKVLTMRQVVDIGVEVIKRAQEAKAEDKKVGIPFGIKWLDDRIGGLQGGDVVVVAGRPGLGKTAFANQFAIHAAGLGFPGAAASLEMYARQVAIRSLAHVAKVNNTRLRFGGSEEAEKAFDQVIALGNLPLFWDFDTYTLTGICAQITHLRIKQNIRFAMVDHIGLVETDGGSRQTNNDRIGQVTRTFKKLAKTLDIPVILLSQMSREIEKARREPIMADLRDSGSIEQDASIVIFPHSETPDGKNPKSISFVMPKNRDGRTGKSGPIYEFDGATQTFRVPAPPEEVPGYQSSDPLSP